MLKQTLLSCAVAAALACALPAHAGLAAAVATAAAEPAANPRADYIRKNYTKFEYRIPARDGTLLFTSVYIPNDAGPNKHYPILMQRTPYTVAPYGAENYKSTLGSFEDYEKEGFIFVFQDVRGKNMSGGEFVNMRPHNPNKKSRTDIDESTDTYDTVEWLVKHVPHNNGRVGQMGTSYPGFYTSMGAIDGHPALKAVSPQAPIADWFRGDDMHRNGAFNLQMAFAFFSGFGKPRPAPTDVADTRRFNYGTPDGYQFLLDIGALSNVDPKFFKGSVPYWNEIAQHPNYDSYWQARNILPHLKNVKAAVLTVGGWYDTEDLYGPLQTYKAIEKQNPGASNTIVMGPWTHGGWSRTTGEKVGDATFGFKTSETFLPLELAFFKHHLKGGAAPALPEAMMFETGANRWRGFAQWPPREAKPATLYFDAAGKLGFEAPKASDGFEEYVSDPAKPVPYTVEIGTGWSKDYIAADQRYAARRPDVVTFQTGVLERDVTFSGPLEAELFVSTTGSDADFVVKLIDVSPADVPEQFRAAQGGVNRGGQQTLVRGEPFRARFRDGFDTPKPMVPGQPVKVKFALNDVLHTFQRGHRIMVQVQSSWFPFIDRNPQTFVPNIFEAKDSDFVKATQRVYRNSAQPSSLKVMLLPAADE
jgi:putative CocE/NonD family hydrolase